MREETKTLTFAAIVCVSCSLLLSGTAAGLKNRQQANAAFDIKRNIVKAFGVNIAGVSRDAINEAYEMHITELVVDAATGDVIEGITPGDISAEELETKLPVYTWTEDGKVVKYAFPISGRGLWSMLYGYLALNSDLETVAGITFYKHGETPGLGAEIEKKWFQDEFVGKHVYENDGAAINFTVSKPGTVLPEEAKKSNIDGISGATLTSNGVQALLRKDIARYATYFNKIRGN